ncbi:transcriptional regulator [Paenibacillus selenitireducens]|uniref:Transcriptional regulator n=2 Tax=Paenibacillus selenitireducens TaxID=1324314 RepID=A0A1T2X667_9BACL|nr:methyltransferase domain-containing protein [Paenibacillus selenitireducens]OPA75374.1 transcriptional regulator [Paenibacillus selenitireducens]
MHINELATKLNISPRAIRFYENKGVITPQKHPTNGYRMFSEEDASRLQTIISLRLVGMSIADIMNVLLEIDKGERNEALYSLELQRSMMFTQFVELIHNIKITDRMIDHLKKQQPLGWDEIFELTNGLKSLNDLRSNWRDHWDFDQQAAIHDELVHNQELEFNQHPSYTQALQTIYQWVHPHKGEKGLDIGTGTGNLASLFFENGVEMAGIDQSKEMLKQCQRKFPEFETKMGNFLAIPYLNHSFDFIVTSYAMHHLTSDQKILALEEMQRVLKPHGRICIADLMFENDETKRMYYQKLEHEGKTPMISQIEHEYYADRSMLLRWFEDHGYLTKTQQMNEILHLIYAVPIKISY